jgi:hypothetical protein
VTPDHCAAADDNAAAGAMLCSLQLPLALTILPAVSATPAYQSKDSSKISCGVNSAVLLLVCRCCCAAADVITKLMSNLRCSR